ncbi:hypothetical protein GGI06_006678, partial [Coemansia sp. S85]
MAESHLWWRLAAAGVAARMPPSALGRCWSCEPLYMPNVLRAVGWFTAAEPYALPMGGSPASALRSATPAARRLARASAVRCRAAELACELSRRASPIDASALAGLMVGVAGATAVVGELSVSRANASLTASDSLRSMGGAALTRAEGDAALAAAAAAAAADAASRSRRAASSALLSVRRWSHMRATRRRASHARASACTRTAASASTDCRRRAARLAAHARSMTRTA